MSYNKFNPRIIKKRIANRARRGEVNFEIYPRKTNNHFYLVVYNCLQKKEVYCYSTLHLRMVDSNEQQKSVKNNIEAAQEVGKAIGEWCTKNNIPAVYFNKLHYKFHGKLEKALVGFNEKFNK